MARAPDSAYHRPVMMLIPLAVLVLPALLATAQGPRVPAATAAVAAVPTVRMTLVRSADAPLLNELESDEPAAEVAHRGDLLEMLRPIPALGAKWNAHMGRVVGEREGPMAEVRRAPGDAVLFAFASDLGEEIDVPSADWFCEGLAANASLPAAARPSRCATLLRRTLLPSGAILAFEACATGPCPVALAKDGALTSIVVDGVVSGSILPGGEDGILLLETRWSRHGGTWSGRLLVPIALSGNHLKRLREIRVDEVDARQADRVISREAEFEVSPAGAQRSVLRVSGTKRQIRRSNGSVITSSAIAETTTLP